MSQTENEEKHEMQADQRNDLKLIDQVALRNTDIEITPELKNNDL